MTHGLNAESTQSVDIQTINSDEAFSEGAELWIIPDRRSSFWAKRIDWHLHFLISKSMIHKSPILSENLVRMMNESEVELFDETAPKGAPLLIFSSNHLPNRQTVQIPHNQSFKTWVERAEEIWLKLNQPSARLFLPNGQSLGDFLSVWKTKSSKVSIVEDFGEH